MKTTRKTNSSPAAAEPQSTATTPTSAPLTEVPIGGVIVASSPLRYNDGLPVRKLSVRNTGDRPIQVGSHFHFFEVNRLLEFDREAAFGHHLNIPSTTAVRFEAGEEKSVEIVPFVGKRRIIGFGGLVGGHIGSLHTYSHPYNPALARALGKAYKRGYKSIKKQ